MIEERMTVYDLQLQITEKITYHLLAKVEIVNKIVYCWHKKFPLFPAKAGNKLETFCASNNYSLFTFSSFRATLQVYFISRYFGI